MRRVAVPELLDSDAGTPHEVADSLRDLRWFNRYFGGLRLTERLLRRVIEQSGLRRLSYLDVASATGDIAAYCVEQLTQDSVRLEPTLMDRVASHLSGNRFPKICGDALALPFGDGVFDVVGSGLFMHHLEPTDAERFLRESLRVCRIAVIVNDLERGWMHFGVALAGIPLYKSRLTRHDAPASVRRAFTKRELDSLARNSGASRIEIRRHYFFRLGVILWK